MDFLKTIRDDLSNPHRRTHAGSNAVVDVGCLEELVRHYETLDSVARTQDRSFHYKDIEKQVADLVTALFQRNEHGAEKVLTLVIDILQPLIDKRNKQMVEKIRYKIPQEKSDFRR